ncbi:cytochrome P450 [Curtobacterium sp. BRB10]|uniref:cytochrome P450 n=1 Tax=Curtobacterium sp. BRB10 TaxID=2962579 RepID=UPI0028818DE8|nr:cytochrome P450 [Curtobacterium sp. BRB10]MDT0234836.1 cytochrome P450 [Curtobacterium sp. BRB10]
MTEQTLLGAPDEAALFPAARASGCPFDPPPANREAQETAPVVRVNLWDGTRPWLVTRYDEQRRLLADPRISANLMRPGYPSPSPIPAGGTTASFILMDDPDHMRLRRMVTAPFAIRRIGAMRPATQAISDRLVDDMLAAGSSADLVESFALPLPSLVISDLLGVPYDDHEFFQRNSKKIIRRDATTEERSAAHHALSAYLDDLLARKRREPQEDLFSDLARRVDGGDLTDQQAANMGVLLLLAGHETTANMIALGTLALLTHPDQAEVLRANPDPAPIAAAVEELLRYLTITHTGMRRVATEDIDVGDVTIRAGEGVILATDIGNRDPSVWGDHADDLDVTRDARRHVAFGFGIHQCLGQPLARMELQVAYSTLLRRLPGLRVTAPLDTIPFKHEGNVYGVHELPVAW